MIKFKNERFNLATSGNPSGSIFQYLRSRTPTCTYAVKDLSLSLSLSPLGRCLELTFMHLRIWARK